MTDSSQPAVPAVAAVPGKVKRKAKAKRKRVAQGKASKTHPSNIEARMKAVQALELRAESKTFREIAQELGYNSPQAAHKAVTTALADAINEAAVDVRKIELIRLDKMFELHYINAQTGDNFATASALRIMERRARILGLDAPTESKATIDHTIAGGVLVVPGIAGEEAWQQAAEKSQEELARAEQSVRV